MYIMLTSDLSGDFERNVEAEILRRIEALPAGQSDPTLMKMLRFASGRRPWLTVKIEWFDMANEPEVRFGTYEDERGNIHTYDTLLGLFSGSLSLEEAQIPTYSFSGANGRRNPSTAERYQR